MKLILSTFILSLYVALYFAERSDYADTLSPIAALIVGVTLAFVGGIVVGVTALYLWNCWKGRHDGAAEPEEHAA